MTKTRLHNDMTDHVGAITLKSKLNYHDQSNRVRCITKTKQDNDMTNRTGVIFIEYKPKLLRLIRKYAIYNED